MNGNSQDPVQEAMRMAREAKTLAERACSDVARFEQSQREHHLSLGTINTSLTTIAVEQGRLATDVKWMREKLAARVERAEGQIDTEKGAKSSAYTAQLIGIIAILVAIIGAVVGVNLPFGGP